MTDSDRSNIDGGRKGVDSDRPGPFAVTRGWCSACENYRHHSFVGMTCYCGNGVIEGTKLVPIGVLEDLADEFEEYSHGKHRNAQELAEVQTWERAYEKVETIIDDYGDTDE